MPTLGPWLGRASQNQGPLGTEPQRHLARKCFRPECSLELHLSLLPPRGQGVVLATHPLIHLSHKHLGAHLRTRRRVKFCPSDGVHLHASPLPSWASVSPLVKSGSCELIFHKHFCSPPCLSQRFFLSSVLLPHFSSHWCPSLWPGNSPYLSILDRGLRNRPLNDDSGESDLGSGGSGKQDWDGGAPSCRGV